MLYYKKIVIDFVEGRMKPKDFVDYCNENDEVLNWIQSVIPEGKICYKGTIEEDEKGIPFSTEEIIPYDIKVVWRQYIMERQGAGSESGSFLNIHHEISRLMLEIFPEDSIRVDTSLQEKFNLLLTILPSYVNGKLAEELVEQFIEEVPENITKTNRIKLLKEKVKEAFHLDGKKYPRWAQDSDWPFSESGKPLKYISQKTKGELVLLRFIDMETGEETIIEDFY